MEGSISILMPPTGMMRITLRQTASNKIRAACGQSSPSRCTVYRVGYARLTNEILTVAACAALQSPHCRSKRDCMSKRDLPLLEVHSQAAAPLQIQYISQRDLSYKQKRQDAPVQERAHAEESAFADKIPGIASRRRRMAEANQSPRGSQA